MSCFIMKQKQRRKQMKNINVVFDQQENKYYRINKSTGEAALAYKNGQLIKRFRVEYSGSDYRLRKEKQADLSPPSIVKPPFRIKYSSKHSSPNNSRHHKQSSSSTSKLLNGDILLTAQSDLLSKCATIDTSLQFKSSRFREPEFSQRLVQFVKIKENKVRQNNSPLKYHQGSLPIQKLLSSYDNRILKGLEFSKQKKKLKSFQNLHPLPEYLNGKRQLSKERQIFYKNHPEVLVLENPRQINELKERKVNLKILQKLSIEQNDKITERIYE